MYIGTLLSIVGKPSLKLSGNRSLNLYYTITVVASLRVYIVYSLNIRLGLVILIPGILMPGAHIVGDLDLSLLTISLMPILYV